MKNVLFEEYKKNTNKEKAKAIRKEKARLLRQERDEEKSLLEITAPGLVDLVGPDEDGDNPLDDKLRAEQQDDVSEWE